MLKQISYTVAAILALVCLSCDTVPLTAPTNSTLTLEAGSRVVDIGGTTEIRALVIESSGTAVQNGTSVLFSTSLGTVNPVTALTHNGVAVTTFFAGNASGVAEVRASSGGAGVGAPTPTTPTTPTTTPTSNSVVLISVGAGAVDTVTVRTNPSVVSANGGTVNVTATVTGTNGRLLVNIPVSFSATRGTLSSQNALTDTNGEARVTLTTNADTSITATAGSKTSTAATVTAQPGPSVQLTCAVGNVTNCATVNQGQAVVFTAQRGSGSSNIASATLDFGDGSSQNVGTLASPVSVPHSYTQAGTFTARLTATDVNGESTSSLQIVQVLAAATASVSAPPNGTLTVTATANTTPAGTQFVWTAPDSTTPNVTTSSNSTSFTYTTPGTKTISVSVTLIDGRTVTASTTVTVP